MPTGRASERPSEDAPCLAQEEEEEKPCAQTCSAQLNTCTRSPPCTALTSVGRAVTAACLPLPKFFFLANLHARNHTKPGGMTLAQGVLIIATDIAAEFQAGVRTNEGVRASGSVHGQDRRTPFSKNQSTENLLGALQQVAWERITEFRWIVTKFCEEAFIYISPVYRHLYL